MDLIENFGKQLRHYIKMAEYKTYQNAADDFEISLSYLNQLMRSEREPSLEVLRTIYNKIKIRMDAINLKLSEKEKELIKENERLKRLTTDPISPDDFAEVLKERLKADKAIEIYIRTKNNTTPKKNELVELVESMTDDEIEKYYQHFKNIINKSRNKNSKKNQKPKSSS